MQGKSDYSRKITWKFIKSIPIGIVQQLGETGSALATLVGILVLFFIPVMLTYVYYREGHRHPYFCSDFMGTTQPPIYYCLCRCWSYLALLGSLRCH